MPFQLEKKLVEEWMIEKLKENGWNYIESENLKRLNLEEPLLLDVLKKKILEINKIDLTDEDLKNVILKLQSVSPDQNGHKEVLRYFKYGVPIKTEKERIVKYVQLFDFKNPKNNEFILTNQFNFSGREDIRLDIVLFVNGIPLVNIECKNPWTNKVDYHSAYKQIKRYEKIAPELYKYIQIGIGAGEVIKYFPIVPWKDEVCQQIWRWEGLKDEEAIFFMLKPENLIDIVRNFVFVREFRGEMTKVIARYMQFRATNKVYQRVIDNLEGKTTKNKGLIWHWQGSGKTLTMIFSAHKLYFELGKPTIFFIVDRKDLERQFSEELSSLDLNFEFEKIESIEALKEVLTYDACRGKRGAFLTLIHKFNLEDLILNEIQKGEIGKRKDVICFLDEVHRTQYGVLASKMKSILKRTFYFGFTGTPISFQDRNTYKEFGYIYEDEKEPYLDRYFIDEAERDGFVVPIVYQLKRDELKLKIPEKELEWYLEKADVEDMADEIEMKGVKEEIKRRLNHIKVFLENEKEIDLICQDIKKDFKENYEGKFKGLIVAGSRLACVRFKKILDRYLPAKESEVVMTFSGDDPQEISEYKRDLMERFKMKDPVEIIKQIVDEKFKKEENPKILIVTDMLITGFDEPKLGVIYLFKFLKGHRLLQTIARVNRPFLGKTAGVVVDYVGIFRHYKKALSNYLEGDVKRISKGILDKNKIFENFLEKLKEIKSIFGDLVGKFEKEALDEALEIVKEEEKGKKFMKLYKELRGWFELSMPDEKIVKYLPEYKWISMVYEYYKKLIGPDIDETKIEKYFKKTLSLIHDVIEVKKLREIVKPTVLNLEYIKKLRNSDLTEKEKAIGTLTALIHICVLNEKNPIYRTIAEKVRRLIKEWQEGKIETAVLVSEAGVLVDYIKEKNKEKEESGLNEVEMATKLFLEKYIKEDKENLKNLSKKLYSQIKPLLYPDWNKNPARKKDVEREIREFLVDLKTKYKFDLETLNKLHQDIFDYVCKFA